MVNPSAGRDFEKISQPGCVRDANAAAGRVFPFSADACISCALPWHLRNLARVDSEVMLVVHGQVTQRSVLDALEVAYPVLRGTIRDHVTAQRRPFLRFYACEEDLSHESPDTPLPEAVVKGTGPFLVIGAIAGG